MITCRVCLLEKPDEEFMYANSRKTRKHRLCSICRRAYYKDNYQQNKVRYLGRIGKYRLDRKELLRNIVWDYLLLHPCVDCGETDPIVLDFDHLSDKDSGISVLVNNASSVQTLQAEIAKCSVRCANCHRRKTAQDGNYWRFKKSAS